MKVFCVCAWFFLPLVKREWNDVIWCSPQNGLYSMYGGWSGCIYELGLFPFLQFILLSVWCMIFNDFSQLHLVLLFEMCFIRMMGVGVLWECGIGREGKVYIIDFLWFDHSKLYLYIYIMPIDHCLWILYECRWSLFPSLCVWSNGFFCFNKFWPEFKWKQWTKVCHCYWVTIVQCPIYVMCVCTVCVCEEKILVASYFHIYRAKHYTQKLTWNWCYNFFFVSFYSFTSCFANDYWNPWLKYMQYNSC